MSKLQELINMHSRVNNEITIRQNILSKIEVEINDMVSVIHPSVIKSLGIDIPKSIRRTRGRVSKDVAQDIEQLMINYADAVSTFTRADMIKTVSDIYPNVSANILNRVFAEIKFGRLGHAEGERGKPVIYQGLA